MATLKDLCPNIPTKIDRLVVQLEVRRRQMKSYSKRMDALCGEQNVFAKCKGTRSKKRWRNNVSSEQAGRIGMCIKEVRFPSAVVVCKTRNIWG